MKKQKAKKLGRPLRHGSVSHVVSVRVPSDYIAVLENLGKGKASEGILFLIKKWQREG